MALRLDVLANTRQFVSEMKKSGASVEDISAALDDMARDGDQATEKLERSFKDLASEASTTGKKIGTDLDDGFDRAKRGAQDFKDEARDTAREAAASFDGSAESIGETFQEVAANALGGFGPLGAAAGVAIAAGIGVGMSALEKFNTAVEESREAAFDLATDVTDRLDFAAAVESWTGSIERFQQAQDIARVTGRDVVDVIKDLATGGDDLAGLREAFEESALYSDVTLTRVTELNGVLQGTEEGFERGAAAAKAMEDAATELGEEERAQLNRTWNLQRKRWEEEKAARERAGQPINTTVRFNVDDSAVRNYRPPVIRLRGSIDEIYVTRNGRRIV